ncbi:MAG: QueT transporter family protein [Candidatus Schekmanbacteria bacterium]|nr:QueT transporter family protein [Candidatus Schekmanbacteria bacterium]
MWKYTKMVVLCSITAGIFAAIVIPMKSIPIIPGSTEIRPASVIPVVFGILFGPAGAWGSAIGNVIGDFFGTLGIGTLFGFFGNFFYSLTAYKLFDARKINSIYNKSKKKILFILTFFYIGVVSSAACASIIAGGLDSLGLVPFALLGSIIFINNIVVSVILGPVVFIVLYPRIEKWDLLWTEIMSDTDFKAPTAPFAGKILIIAGSLCAIGAGLILSSGISASIPFLSSNQWMAKFGTTGAVAASLLVLLIGCLIS